MGLKHGECVERSRVVLAAGKEVVNGCVGGDHMRKRWRGGRWGGRKMSGGESGL